LHLVGVTRQGRVWHAARVSTSWRPFEDVVREASLPGLSHLSVRASDVAIGVCNEDVPRENGRDVSQVNLVLYDEDALAVWQTIWSNPPIQWNVAWPAAAWKPLNKLAAFDGFQHVLALSTGSRQFPPPPG
jgi:hypothetical protein